MAQAVNDIAGSFISTNNELMFGHGYGSSSEDIRTYLQGGSWVNYPGLQKNGARDSMIAIMQSMMINSLWRMQRVFIIGGGACGDGQDIGHGIAGSGDNTICDDNNRAWYLYYWQKQNGPSTKTDGWVARHWGSDRMGASPIYQGSGPFWKNLNPLVYDPDTSIVHIAYLPFLLSRTPSSHLSSPSRPLATTTACRP